MHHAPVYSIISGMNKSQYWYFWEKAPGRIAVLWASRINEHRDKFIGWYFGSLEQAIEEAKFYEEHGYSIDPQEGINFPEEWEGVVAVAPKKNEPQAIENEIEPQEKKEGIPLESVMVIEDYTVEETHKTRRTPQKKQKAEKDPLQDYEVKGQISLFDLMRKGNDSAAEQLTQHEQIAKKFKDFKETGVKMEEEFQGNAIGEEVW